MQPAGGDDSQKWDIEPWGGGSYMFVHVKNGSGYRMGCHPGNLLFTSSETTGTPEPAQHWLFSSLAVINDGGVFNNDHRRGEEKARG
jgi:hypothetical protein